MRRVLMRPGGPSPPGPRSPPAPAAAGEALPGGGTAGRPRPAAFYPPRGRVAWRAVAGAGPSGAERSGARAAAGTRVPAGHGRAGGADPRAAGGGYGHAWGGSRARAARAQRRPRVGGPGRGGRGPRSRVGGPGHGRRGPGHGGTGARVGADREISLRPGHAWGVPGMGNAAPVPGTRGASRAGSARLA